MAESKQSYDDKQRFFLYETMIVSIKYIIVCMYVAMT